MHDVIEALVPDTTGRFILRLSFTITRSVSLVFAGLAPESTAAALLVSRLTRCTFLVLSASYFCLPETQLISRSYVATTGGRQVTRIWLLKALESRSSKHNSTSSLRVRPGIHGQVRIYSTAANAVVHLRLIVLLAMTVGR